MIVRIGNKQVDILACNQDPESVRTLLELAVLRHETPQSAYVSQVAVAVAHYMDAGFASTPAKNIRGIQRIVHSTDSAFLRKIAGKIRLFKRKDSRVICTRITALRDLMLRIAEARAEYTEARKAATVH